MTAQTLHLRLAADVRRPRRPPVPPPAVAQVGGTATLWRCLGADDVVVGLVHAYKATKWKVQKDELHLVAARRKGEVLAAFDLGKPATRHSFRHVVGVHPSGDRFLYAHDRKVLELRLDTPPTLKKRFTIRAGKMPPHEAVYVGEHIVCSSEDHLYLLDAAFRPLATYGLGDIGYFHLAVVGELVVACCYDTSTTAGGPTFLPDIVALRIDGDRLVEVARGTGPGSKPFVVDGRLFVTHQRKTHEVMGLPAS